MSSWQLIPTQDRISDLPDSLICHILSFIPTKLAVTTSVLSKRWTLLWQSVLTLNFDQKPFKNFATFCNSVDKVIESRDATLPLSSFRIKCHETHDFNPHDLHRFVQAALQRGIQNFNLNLSKYFFYAAHLTPTIFSLLTCRTLVVLKLKNLIIVDVPQLVDLPLLKTLNLVSILFAIKYVDFKRLLYGCPILENLKTNNLRPGHFSFSDYDSDQGDYKAFPKLVRANINFRWRDFRLSWFQNVKFLGVSLLSSTLCYQVPTFHNLTNLELIFDSRYSWSDKSYKWTWVIQVLQHCPKLQDLTIDEASRNIHVGEEWEVPETVPECILSQLTKCSLKSYNDIECERQFAKYTMLNSKQLRTMTIKSSSLVCENAKDQMLVSLLSCPMGSAKCKLLVD